MPGRSAARSGPKSQGSDRSRGVARCQPHSFHHSFVHSFVHSFIQPRHGVTDKSMRPVSNVAQTAKEDDARARCLCLQLVPHACFGRDQVREGGQQHSQPCRRRALRSACWATCAARLAGLYVCVQTTGMVAGGGGGRVLSRLLARISASSQGCIAQSSSGHSEDAACFQMIRRLSQLTTFLSTRNTHTHMHRSK